MSGSGEPGRDPEPPPAANASRPIWELVVEDLQVMGHPERPEVAAAIADARGRDAFGRAKYGTPLQAGNGRDALVDAYQEFLDAAVYLRQALAERHDGVVRAYYLDALNAVLGVRKVITERGAGRGSDR